MKKYIISLILMFYGFWVCAQDSTAIEVKSRYFGLLQYAGSHGKVSGGLGVKFFEERFDLSLIYGYTPSNNGGVAVNTFSIRNSYIVFPIKTNKVDIDPYVGFSISYSGHTPMPIPMFIGSDFSISNNRSSILKKTAVFLQMGTTGMRAVHKLDNKTISISDIINFSFGLKLSFDKKGDSNE